VPKTASGSQSGSGVEQLVEGGVTTPDTALTVQPQCNRYRLPV